MEFDLPQTIAVLERTPRALIAWLGGLPEEWTSTNEGPGTWSAFDVLGHLIHGERTDWMARLRIILQHGRARPFDPFNREAMFTESLGLSMTQLLARFAELRSDNVAQLRALNLQPEQFALEGEHPALGTVTLAQLLATWAAHDLSHMYQIAHVMSRQYKDAVGPWQAYMKVLQN